MSGSQFDAAQSGLATEYGIHVKRLAGSVAAEVTQRQAEDVALRHFGVEEGTSVEAIPVTATDDAYAKVEADGTHTFLISDRPVWLVLLPNQQVPIRGRKGPPFSYTATLAVLIDADSGEFIKAASLAS